MKQLRKKKKNHNEKSKWINILTFFVFAPTVAILLGAGIVKYVILPIFIPDEGVNRNATEVSKRLDEETPKKEDISQKVDDALRENESSKDDDKQKEEYEKLQLTREKISFYTVQVGSFTEQKNAQILIEDMKEKGLGGFIVKTDNYKVLAKSFYNREELSESIIKIKEVFSDAFINTITIERESISYTSDNKEYAESLKAIFDAIDKSYGEEASLWEKTMEDNDISLLAQIMKENTKSFETELGKIKDKAKDKELNKAIKNIDTLIADRKIAHYC